MFLRDSGFYAEAGPYLILSYLMVQAAKLDSHNDNGLDTTRRASYKFVSSASPRPFSASADRASCLAFEAYFTFFRPHSTIP